MARAFRACSIESSGRVAGVFWWSWDCRDVVNPRFHGVNEA